MSDEQPPPENHIIGHTGGEKEMSGPSTVSNAPPQPSKLHQAGTFNDSPNGLAPEAVDVVVQQPNLSDLKNTMNKVLEVLQDSTIACKGGKDVRSRFWTIHKRVAEEHDGDFLERYSSDMDIVLIFSGLFSAVSTSFIVAMESSLSPDPSDTTNALLTQLVQIGLGNLVAAGVEPAAPASAWSPPTSIVRIQEIAYASLSMSLLAAFGAVLGKQWLGYYKSSRYGRGSPEERGKRRQEKFDGIITWYFDAVLQLFPILLQLSLLLFGIALSANMWYKPRSIAWVLIATTVFGFLFYSLTLMAALVSPACPFQTPISTILRILHVDRVLRPMVKLALGYFQWLTTSVHGVLHVLFLILELSWMLIMILYLELAGLVDVVRSFARRCLQPLFCALHIFVSWLRSLVVRSVEHVEDSEAQVEDFEAQSHHWNLRILGKGQYHLDLWLPDTSGLEASSIKWLLETSTDPDVFVASASLVPQVEWPVDLDISNMLHQLYNIYESCMDVQSRIIPSLEDKASVCTMALSHLYCGHALQAYTGDGFLHAAITRSSSMSDAKLFERMSKGCKSQEQVFALIGRLSTGPYSKVSWDEETRTLRPKIEDRHLHPIEFADSAPEWLSQILPYHFVAGRVDEDLEKLAIAVISKLLSPPSTPSTQIIANCILLACVMIGVQFDKEDIVRIDKSSALQRLAESLWEQFQTTLWGDLDEDSIGVRRRIWNLTDVICRMLQLGHSRPVSLQVMMNLDLCRKIYLRARSSEQNDADPLAALRRVHRFRFDVALKDMEDQDERGPPGFRSDVALEVSDRYKPCWVPEPGYRVSFDDNSYSPEDFDWLVDYLDVVYSNDHDTSCDILFLMSSMSVTCSPAKQHLFIERLIACMDSSMPDRLRHLALCAADSSREVLTSITAVDDADTVLTKFSAAIMSAVCPRPGATPVGDGPDRFCNDERDLCYLKVVFALTRNSIWHPHLVADHHIDRCIGMIAECCKSPSKLQHSCNIVGILLRIAPEQVSVTSLESITQQCWAEDGDINQNPNVDELLPVLAEVTQKYMQIASKSDLEQLIKDMDRVVRSGRMRTSGQWRRVKLRGVDWVDDVKELGTVARDMLLQRFGQ